MVLSPGVKFSWQRGTHYSTWMAVSNIVFTSQPAPGCVFNIGVLGKESLSLFNISLFFQFSLIFSRSCDLSKEQIEFASKETCYFCF